MIVAPKPANEEKRLEALRGFHILDTPAEQTFDDLVRLASYVCQTPVAMVSFVDRERQWFKARIGVQASETSRDIAFCAHAILRPQELLIVPDATKDERFSDHPLVLDAPNIRFYAGAPLVTQDGFALGTLCVVDHSPKELSPEQKKALTILRNLVVRELELHKKNIELSDAVQKLEQKEIEFLRMESRYRRLVEVMREAVRSSDAT
jgi:adenylate cyclase